MTTSGVLPRHLVLLSLMTIVSASSLHAQGFAGQGGQPAASLPSATRPSRLKGVTIRQQLNAQIPLGLHFRDETGKAVTLQEYFTDQPVILNLAYYQCSMLCPAVLQGLVRSLKLVQFEVGKQYKVLTVSFDPRDTPEVSAEKKKMVLAQLGQPAAGSGWHFLTGDQESIRKLTDAVGFIYRWDPGTQQFFHAAGIMILTPQGKLSKYFYGIEFKPADLRFGLVQASDDHIGTLVDAVLLFCCRYDPTAGKYNWLVGRILSIAGMFTILILGSFLIIMFKAGPHPGRTS